MSSTSTTIHPPFDSKSSASFKTLSLSNLHWELSKQADFSESRNIYMTTSKGQHVFFQIAYTTLGWSPSCQISARFFDPAADINMLESLNISAKHLCHDNSKCHCSIAVKDGKMTAAIIHKGPKFSVSFVGKHGLCINMEFDAEQQGFQVGQDGSVHFGKHKDEGRITAKLFPRIHCKGSVSIDGESMEVEGHGVVLHMLQSIKPYAAATEWFLVNFQSSEASLIISQFEATKSYASTVINQAGFTYKGEHVGFSVDNTITPLHQLKCPHSGYSVFSEIIYESRGILMDKRPFHIKIHTIPTQLCDRIDILSHLPFLIRKLIQLLITKPYVYQWLDEAEAEITIGDESIKLKGQLFHEYSILNQ